MGRQGTGRRTDWPALTCIAGEPELRLRAWLAKSPGWSTWKEHGQWHAGFNGFDLVDDYNFAVFVQKLEDLSSGRSRPAADHLAACPADYADPPDDIA
jgi:hypothetical protein